MKYNIHYVFSAGEDRLLAPNKENPVEADKISDILLRLADPTTGIARLEKQFAAWEINVVGVHIDLQDEK